MFSLFKKIANYFTPLDEEAEVERAAAASPVVNSDDDNLATRTASDKMSKDQPLDNGDTAFVESAKKKRSPKTQKPGVRSFKVDLGPNGRMAPSTTPSAKNAPKNKDGRFRLYEYGKPSSRQGGPNDGSQKSASGGVKNEVAAPMGTNQQGDKSATKHTGRTKDTSATSDLQLGKRKTPIDEPDTKTKKTKLETSPPPTKTRRRLQKPNYEPHATRGRSKKLGDHQCLICGDTFFDLESRDSHAKEKHPRASQWKH